eukprot:s6932_g2.t1
MCCIIFSVTVACATVVGFTCRQHSERNRACRSSPVVADLAGLGSGCRANLEGFESGHSGTNRGDNPSPPEPQPDLSATPLWRIPAICTGIRSEAKGFVDRSEGLLGLDSEHAFLAVVLPLIQDMKVCAGTAVDNNRHISTAFRPLSTDAQVRVLGDLDLGHRLQPVPMLAGPCQSLEPVPFVPQSYQQPNREYVQGPAQAQHAPLAAPNGGPAHLPPGATAAALNGAFASQVASHVQLVYRASVYPT